MNMIKIYFIIIVFYLCGYNTHAQKFERLAETPPMGWNSWNNFACNVNEDLIKEMADAMVESGMKDAGYEYVIIDPSSKTQVPNKRTGVSDLLP